MGLHILTRASFLSNQYTMTNQFRPIFALFFGVLAVQSAPGGQDDVKERIYPGTEFTYPANFTGGLFVQTDFLIPFPFLSFIEGPLCTVALIGRSQAVGSAFCIDNHLYDTEDYVNFLGVFRFLSRFIKRKVLIIYGLQNFTRDGVRNAYDNHDSVTQEITRNDVVFPRNYSFLNINNICRNDIAMVNLPKPIKHSNPIPVAANNINGLSATLQSLTNLYVSGFGSRSCSADGLGRRRANAAVVPCPPIYGNVSSCGNQICVNLTSGGSANVYESIGDMGGPLYQLTDPNDLDTGVLIGVMTFQNKLTPIGEGCTAPGEPIRITLLPFYAQDFQTDFDNSNTILQPLALN